MTLDNATECGRRGHLSKQVDEGMPRRDQHRTRCFSAPRIRGERPRRVWRGRGRTSREAQMAGENGMG
eukprot:6951580-Pyramimonas_sp.AAC.1